MDIAIEDAVQADLPGILAIYNDVIIHSTAIYTDTPETLGQREVWWRQRQSQGYPVLVAKNESGVLGFASFGDFRSGWPGYRFTVEHSVHVRSDRRRAGAGTALVRALMARATSLGKHAILGGVDAENAASIRFHERLGFEQVARLRQVGWKFGRWLDLVFLERLLESPTYPGSQTV